MYQEVVYQTFEEKFQMYNRLEKEELIKMLIQANDVLSNIHSSPYLGSSKQVCLHDMCSSCHGKGFKIDGSFCVHNLSCSCPKCSPR